MSDHYDAQKLFLYFDRYFDQTVIAILPLENK